MAEDGAVEAAVWNVGGSMEREESMIIFGTFELIYHTRYFYLFDKMI